MSLLNKASLIQIPSGYKDGTLYSAKPTNGDGDFTFSRGSNLAATRVNSEGLIEKGRENLLTYSNNFDSSDWTKINNTRTSGQSGYDGSADAWLVNATGAGAKYILENNTSTGVHTFSLYAKKGTTKGIRISINGGGDHWANFNLDLGTQVGTAASVVDTEIVSVGSGWYRISVTANKTASGWAAIYPLDNSFNANYTAAGENLYIQDAQLELGLVATDYIETTTTTEQAGILEDMPRLDYSGKATCPSLLLEPQRSNLVTQSEFIGSSDWSKTNVSTTSNAATSPQGVSNATEIIENSSNVQHFVGDSLSLTSGTSYSVSVYAKKNTRSVLQISPSISHIAASYANYDLENGVVSASGGSVTTSIEDIGNGWYRCVLTFTPTSTATATLAFFMQSSTTAARGAGYAGDGSSSLYAFGFQVEEGSYPTSYIPSYGGSSVTRSGDSCSGAGNAGVFNDSEGVLYAEFSTFINAGGGTRRIQIQSSGSTQYVRLQVANGDGTLYVTVYNGSQQYLYNDTSFDSTAVNKVALRYAPNNFALYVNGVKLDSQLSGSTFADGVLTETNFSPPSPFYGNIKQTLVFSTALTDDELAELTTI